MFINCVFYLINLNVNLIDNDFIINLINMYNFFSYIFYKYFNIIYYSFKIYFYWIYNVFIHKQTYSMQNPNKFYLLTLYKKIITLYFYFNLFLKKVVKPRRWWKIYFKFYFLDYLKIVIFILYFILFILMWKRRNTYLKRAFFKQFIHLVLISMYLSFILNLFLPYYGSLLAIILTYIYLLMKLN